MKKDKFYNIKRDVTSVEKTNIDEIERVQETLFNIEKKIDSSKPNFIKKITKNIQTVVYPHAETYFIWTDGACSHNPGPGAWASIIRWQLSSGKQEEIYLSGYANNTTNNKMELTAAKEALKKIPNGKKVQLYTDSQYLKNGIEKWIENWKKKNWKKADKKPVLNQDLWKELDNQKQQKKIQWFWVKGHSNNLENELCDKIARELIKKNS